MSLSVIAVTLAGVAVLVWPDRSPGVTRGAAGRQRHRGFPPLLRRILPAAGIALATTFLAPAFWWCGVLLAVPVGVFLAGRAGRPSAQLRREHRRSLAGHLDLIGACLRSGLPIAAALTAVARACQPADDDPLGRAGSPGRGGSPGRVGSPGRPRLLAGAGPGARMSSPIDLLDEVAALLTVGADPPTAWAAAAGHPDLTPITAAACRSATGGSALAAAFAEQSELLRRQNTDAAASAAGRAGVLMTAPLGACFLPAFLCLGLAPAIVGLLGTLHLW